MSCVYSTIFSGIYATLRISHHWLHMKIVEWTYKLVACFTHITFGYFKLQCPKVLEYSISPYLALKALYAPLPKDSY